MVGTFRAAEIQPFARPLDPPGVALLLVGAVALVLRRRYPAVVLGVALGVVVVFSFVLVVSYLVFWAIKATYGLRVSADEEEAGLDISEHGMYGYPEQFIPTPELVGYGAAPTASYTPSPATPTTQEVPA